MTLSIIRQGACTVANDPRPTAMVIPFRTGAGRPQRGSAGANGQILLFTGVRYERTPEAGTTFEPASAQRRHS